MKPKFARGSPPGHSHVFICPLICAWPCNSHTFADCQTLIDSDISTNLSRQTSTDVFTKIWELSGRTVQMPYKMASTRWPRKVINEWRQWCIMYWLLCFAVWSYRFHQFEPNRSGARKNNGQSRRLQTTLCRKKIRTFYFFDNSVKCWRMWIILVLSVTRIPRAA